MGAASAAYCALSAGSKPIEEVPKVILAWEVGAWKARYARENLRRAPCRASSAPQWRRYLPSRVGRDRRLHRNGPNLAPVAYGCTPGRLP